MTTAPPPVSAAHPLNSREYHEAAAAKHAAHAKDATANRAFPLAAWHADLAAWHTAEALAEAPAQTAPEGIPAR